MSDATARFAFPFILPGQAQKELSHNEALTRLDVALHPAVESAALQSPPGDPLVGQSWIVAAGASGAWAGKAGQIAHWSAGGWRFVAPTAGMLAWNRDTEVWIHFTGSEWNGGDWPVAKVTVGGLQVVGERQPDVPSPSGGTTIDQPARDAIDGLIATLKSHGLIG